MDWDYVESILWNYYQDLPEPKISFESWWYGDGSIREMLQTHHIIELSTIVKEGELK